MLPPLLDKPSILVALNQVAQALAEDRIKRSVAHTLLSAIKLANRILNEIAESGAIVPTGISSGNRIVARQTDRTISSDGPNGAVALAACGAHPEGSDAFNPARRYRSHGSLTHLSDIDPSTARIVRELVAQSHKSGWDRKVRP